MHASVKLILKEKTVFAVPILNPLNVNADMMKIARSVFVVVILIPSSVNVLKTLKVRLVSVVKIQMVLNVPA